jgi:hypothetical protein
MADFCCLNNRAWPIRIGTEHATIIRFRFEDGSTTQARVEKDTAVSRHRLSCRIRGRLFLQSVPSWSRRGSMVAHNPKFSRAEGFLSLSSGLNFIRGMRAEETADHPGAARQGKRFNCSTACPSSPPMPHAKSGAAGSRRQRGLPNLHSISH